MASTIRIPLFWVVLASMFVLWTDSQFVDILCDTAPEGEDYCEYTEGDIAWFHSEVEPEGKLGSFRTGVVWTEGGQYSGRDPIPNVDDATPVLDYGPIVLENLFYLDYIPVELVDDCEYEKDEVFYTLTRAEPIKGSGSPEASNGVAVIITDNDDNFYFEFEQYDIMETIGKFEFKVCRVGILADEATIEWSTKDATATSSGDDRDFIPVTNENIEFDLNAECELASLDIIPDLNSFEESEVFYIDISYIETSQTGCTGKVIHPSRAIVTIHDATTSLFNIKECNYAVTEPQSGTTAKFSFIIERDGDTTSSSTIVYSTRAVSARTGKDFEGEVQTEVDFQPGETEKEAYVTINSDTSDEDPETFEVSISKPAGEIGIIREPSKAVITIHDIQITKCCARFDTSVNVVLESSLRATLIIQREGNLDKLGIIDVQTEDVDATTESGDYIAHQETLTFQAGESTTSISVPINNDNFKEDTECFKVNLIVPENENAMDLCSPQSTVVMIKDDDDCYDFEGVYFRIMEDDGIVEIDIARSGYLGKTSYVYVTVQTNPRTNAADNNKDFSLRINSDNRIAFGVNEKSKTLIIDITTGDGYEGVEEFTLILDSITTSSPFVYPNQIGVTNKATVVIYDDFVCNPPCVNGECVHDNICECPPTFTGSLCQTAVKSIGASFTIIESPLGTPIEFIDDFYDQTSAAYLIFVAGVEQQLILTFSSLPGFESLTILGIYPGSVRVDYAVNFATDSDTNLGDVSNMFNEAVGEGGLLGNSDLVLSPTDIDCPDNYCQNGGECMTSDSGYFCDCPAGYYGAQCLTSVAASGVDESGTVGNDTEGISDGTLVGIVIGVVVLILLLILLLVFCMFLLRRRRKQPPQPQQDIQLRPYEGPNPNYVFTNGIMNLPSFY